MSLAEGSVFCSVLGEAHFMKPSNLVIFGSQHPPNVPWHTLFLVVFNFPNII